MKLLENIIFHRHKTGIVWAWLIIHVKYTGTATAEGFKNVQLAESVKHNLSAYCKYNSYHITYTVIICFQS